MTWFVILLLLFWLDNTIKKVEQTLKKPVKTRGRTKPRRRIQNHDTDRELRQATREYEEALQEYNRVMQEIAVEEQKLLASATPTESSTAAPNASPASEDHSGSASRRTTTVTEVTRYSKKLADHFQGMKWNYRKWDCGSWDRPAPAVRAQREKLLRESFAIARDEKENGEVCQHIVEVALENELYPLACQVLRYFNDPDPDLQYESIHRTFDNPGCWQHIDSVLTMHVARYLVKETHGKGSEYYDGRSYALAAFGKFLFFTGRYQQACKVWEHAADQSLVDSAIASICKCIAVNEPKHLHLAIELAQSLRDRKERANTITTLTEYLDSEGHESDDAETDQEIDDIRSLEQEMVNVLEESDQESRIHRAVAHLQEANAVPFPELEDLPAKPGLYAFFVRTPTALSGTILEAAEATHPIYVGKAKQSLRDRDLHAHFSEGKSGHSTVRRSLIAVLREHLGLRVVPRNDTGKKVDVTHYRSDDKGERALSEWMREHLELSWWVYDPKAVHKPLKTIEQEAIRTLSPPLNLTHSDHQLVDDVRTLRRRCVQLAQGNRVP